MESRVRETSSASLRPRPSSMLRAALLLAGVVLVAVGVLTMHSLGVGHHGGHVLAEGSDVHSVGGHDGAAGSPSGVMVQVDLVDDVVSAACPGDCDPGGVGGVCLALLVGVALVVLLGRHRLGSRAGGVRSRDAGARRGRRVVRWSGRPLLVLLCTSRV